MPRHQVRKGEDLAHVLARYRIAGGSDSVVNAPENEALFATRTRAVLYEGDEIEVPEGAPQRFVVQTGRTHTFVVRRAERVLTLRIVDAGGEPVEGDYVLEVRGERHEGLLEGGHAEVLVPLNAVEVTLELGDETRTLRIAHLDPVTTITGLQARLQNLGLLVGAPSGDLDAATVRAVRRFQTTHQLPTTGHADPATRGALVAAQGG